MFDYIMGEVVRKGERYLTLDHHGMGYRVSMDDLSLSEIAVGTTITLYVYYHITEDERALYGFLTEEDKTIFALVTSVSGMGMKMALNLFSNQRASSVASAIFREDVLTLKRSKGLGEKLAQKLILELKEKMGKYAITGEGLFLASPLHSEVAEALRALGYKDLVVRRVIGDFFDKNPEDMTTSEALKKILPLLSKFK